MPFKILVLGDFTRRPDPRYLDERRPIRVDRDTFDAVLAGHALALELTVPDRISGRDGEPLSVSLTLACMKDFTPEGIASQVPTLRELVELRQALNALKAPLGGIPAFRKTILKVLDDAAGRERLRRELGLGGTPPAVDAAEGTFVDDVLREANIKPAVEGYDTASQGMRAFLTTMLSPEFEGARVDKSALDRMIADIDLRLSAQVNLVLHDPAFQGLEAAWRSLKYLVDQVDFRENITVEVCNCSKDDLVFDFEDSPEATRSGLYKIVYGATFGFLGCIPYGLIVADYEFGPGPQDVNLLSGCATVSAMAHTPFLAAASPAVFGITSWEQLPAIPSSGGEFAHFNEPAFARWQSFRESEDARWVGLCLPRCMLRFPYGGSTFPGKSFNFEEDVDGHDERYLWGNAAYALATRAADSFAKYRWCPNIIGPTGGGQVEDLPEHQDEWDREIETRAPVECQLTERQVYDLSEAGFIGLTWRKDSNVACFLSANSCRKARCFGTTPEEREAETNFRLDGQLPYLFMIARIAQCLKFVNRYGRWGQDAYGRQRGINSWLGSDIKCLDGTRRRLPFREASVTVEAWDFTKHRRASGYWAEYHFELRLQPNFKYMGTWFTLSLTGGFE